MPKKKYLSFLNRTKNGSLCSTLSDYKKRLHGFYKEINFLKFMSDKREIARQDVLLTPEGPVELYRRDTNGQEKYLNKDSIVDKIADRSSRSFLNKIYSRPTSVVYDDYSQIYSSSQLSNPTSSVLRDPNGRFGVAFDWYDETEKQIQVLHEEYEVLAPRRRRRALSTYDKYRYSNSKIYEHHPSVYYSNKSLYSDDDRLFNKRNYDIYQYYEYECDSDVSDRSHRRRRRRSYSRAYNQRLPTPVPPIPPKRSGRRPRKIISYIDYDTHEDTQPVKFRNKKVDKNISPLRNETKAPSLSSSASGKELWKKVDNYANNKNQTSQTSLNKNNNTNNTSNPSNTSNTVLKNLVSTDFENNLRSIIAKNDNKNNNQNQSQQQQQKLYLLNNTSKQQQDQLVGSDINHNNFHFHKPQAQVSMHDDNFTLIAPITQEYQEQQQNTSSINTSTLSNFHQNFKKRPQKTSKYQENNSNFNDLPGNNAIRTNPLFNLKNDERFVY